MIWQRFLLYIAAGAVTVACPLGPVAPEPVIPLPVVLEEMSLDSALAWARGTTPRSHVALRFKWRYEDEAVIYAGRGTARIAPPDSVRFDYAGPLGFGSGAAALIGDSVAWAEPNTGFVGLVPAVPMFWAALGVIRPLPATAARGLNLRGPDASRWLVRFLAGPDTLDYALADGELRRLDAEWRRAGHVIARSRTEYDGELAREARVDFPEGPARFELTVVGVDTAGIPPELWLGR